MGSMGPPSRGARDPCDNRRSIVVGRARGESAVHLKTATRLSQMAQLIGFMASTHRSRINSAPALAHSGPVRMLYTQVVELSCFQFFTRANILQPMRSSPVGQPRPK
jgi:hypothetical protein